MSALHEVRPVIDVDERGGSFLYLRYDVSLVADKIIAIFNSWNDLRRVSTEEEA